MAGKSSSASSPSPAPPSSFSTTAAFLNRQKWSHEVALIELNALHSSRAVYQKNGNLYFRTNIQQATASEQRHLDITKAKLQKLNSPS